MSRTRRSRARWRGAFFTAVAAALVAAGVAWAATGITSNAFRAAYGEANSYDSGLFAISATGELVNVLAVSAAGTSSGSAVEIALVAGAANTALAAGEWYYTATVAEAGIATVTSGTYKAELFQNGTSKGSLYFKQDTSDALNAESILLKWALGSSLPAASAYTLKVTQV